MFFTFLKLYKSHKTSHNKYNTDKKRALFWKIRSSYRSRSVEKLFLPKACNFIKKDTQKKKHECFPVNFFEIFWKAFFYRTPPVVASEKPVILLKMISWETFPDIFGRHHNLNTHKMFIWRSVHHTYRPLPRLRLRPRISSRPFILNWYHLSVPKCRLWIESSAFRRILPLRPANHHQVAQKSSLRPGLRMNKGHSIF